MPFRNDDFPLNALHVNREHGAERDSKEDVACDRQPTSKEVAISSPVRGKRAMTRTEDYDDNDDDGDYEMTRER